MDGEPDPHPARRERIDRVVVATLLAREPAFRNLLYYRLCQGGGYPRLLVGVLKRFWRPEATLRLYPDSLGPRCLILHGWETTVVARSHRV